MRSSSNNNLQSINVDSIRLDFPVLKRTPYGSPLIYLDSAATSQKPTIVIDALNEYYRNYNSNVHRGIYSISIEASEKYEDSRKKVSKFINSKNISEIIFTRNTTESINLVAYSWARSNLEKNDKIILTEMEHHSNIVPWQILSEEKNIEIDFIKITEEGLLDFDHFLTILDKKTKLVSLTHVSNVLGTINPINKIIKASHDFGAKVLIDAAQSVPHFNVDVQQINCDFLAFSSHKMLGPMGIGVLYAKEEILNEMVPFMVGGDMIKEVYLEKSFCNDIPWKFEAGTPNVGGSIALGYAIDYLTQLGMDNVFRHEQDLTSYAYENLIKFADLQIYGPTSLEQRCGLISFNLGDIHPHDLATIMDEEGVCIRAGHHCAMPLMNRLNVSATSRISFYIYNTYDDVDMFLKALSKAKKVFKL